jgi:tripartite-type tricarboxylate transporter receptor subunit TctC
MKKQTLFLFAGCFCLALLFSPIELLSAPYYEGKALRFVVGAPPGGGYDRMARILARNLPRYIPGKPTIIVENMEGAGSMVAGNYIYSQAKPDGLTIGGFNRAIFSAQLLKIEGMRFDIMKFPWIGSAAVETTVLAIRTDFPCKTYEDLKKSKDPIHIGCVGPGNANYDLAILLKQFLGLNFKMVTGYISSTEIMLAVERKEVDGVMFAYSSIRPYEKRGLVRPLLRSKVSVPGVEKLPVSDDLVTDKVGKVLLAMVSVSDRIGRPYVAPPGTPADIMNILRDAFANVAKDPVAQEDAKKNFMDMEYTPADECLKQLRYLFNQPPDIIKEFTKYIKF